MARTLPHSLDAEQSVLGGLMLDNERYDDIADLLSATDFYQRTHQDVYAAIAEMLSRGLACDLVTLSENLKGKALLEQVGGLSYLGSLANETPGSSNVVTYAEIVRSKAVLRSLLAAIGDIEQAVYKPDGRTVEEILGLAEEKVLAIRRFSERGNRHYQDMPALLDAVQIRLEKLFANPDGLAGLPTGFTDLDRLTTGMHPGELIVIGARPSVGKTSLAMNIAEHAAVVQQKAVAVFSLEMQGEELALRMLSSFSRIPFSGLRSGHLNDRDMDRLVSSDGILRNAKIFVDASPGLSSSDLRAKARRIQRERGLDLVIVDYIQIMRTPGFSDNRANAVAEISRDLKILAKELGVPVIALSQLNRKSEDQGRKPLLSDLRESGGIEQDADVVLLLHRQKKEGESSNADGMAEIIVAKQRNGPLDTIRTTYLGQFIRFENYAGGDGMNY